MADPAAADPAAEDPAQRRGPGARAVPGARHLEHREPHPARVDARAHQRARPPREPARARPGAPRDAARAAGAAAAQLRRGTAAAERAPPDTELAELRAQRRSEARRRDLVTLGAALLLGGLVWLAVPARPRRGRLGADRRGRRRCAFRPGALSAALPYRRLDHPSGCSSSRCRSCSPTSCSPSTAR